MECLANNVINSSHSLFAELIFLFFLEYKRRKTRLYTI